MRIVFLAMMTVMGAVMGSFLCCQARRLRLRELGKKKLGRRSVCLKCGTRLKWWENIPILSWVMLRGKCHKCGAKIGVAEVLAEIGGAVTFLTLGLKMNLATATMLDWAGLLLLILGAIGMIFLAIYDGLYGELPLGVLTFTIICGIMRVVVTFVAFFQGQLIWETLGAVGILGGTYLLLYLVSRGKWVGNGDWLLGMALGLFLMDPWLALVVLFLANLLAVIVMLPMMLKTRKNKNRQIYFGPFMVAAEIIVLALAEYVIIRI